MRESGGFTLVEVLVTLVILSTGIVLVLRAFETSLVALGDARDNLWAVNLMRQKTAEAELALAAGSSPPSTSESFDRDPYRGFRCDRVIARIDEVQSIPSSGIGGCTVYEINTVVNKPGFRLNVAGTTRVIGAERGP